MTSGFTGADLENLVNEAALLAGRENKTTVGKEEFEKAVLRTVARRGKETLAVRTEREIQRLRARSWTRDRFASRRNVASRIDQTGADFHRRQVWRCVRFHVHAAKHGRTGAEINVRG